MQQKKRSPGFILAILCTFTLLLAACQAGTSPPKTAHQNTTRLNLQASPGSMTTTPGTSVPGANKPAEYVGHSASDNTWVGLSTTGKRVVAFVTDGSEGHAPTFAQWFRGSLTNDVFNATAKDKSGEDHMQARLSGSDATGTVTLADGKSLNFTANPVVPMNQTAGLYRSEHTAKGQHYIAGWIVLPENAGTPTPQATGAATPGATSVATATATAAATAAATGTTTPAATSTATGRVMQQGGAIRNEQTSQVMAAPPLTQEQIKSKEITAPNLGTFKLVPCQKNLC